MDFKIAAIRKTPIINQINLSVAIASEKACPELIISVRGSNGSTLKLNLYNYYKNNLEL